MDVKKFDTPNAAGGSQYVAHRMYIGGSSSKYSVWFSDTDGGSLVDMERIDRLGRSTGVRNTSSAWRTAERRIKAWLAANAEKPA